MMKRLLIVVLFVGSVISCGRKQENQSGPSPESRTFELERENFFNSLKQLDDVSSLAQGNIAFNVSLLNDPERFYQYTSGNIMAAANLGVYISDLNYCVIFKQKEEVKKYFHAVYELGKAIQVEQSILEFLLMRYEKNIEQNDSVKVVVKQLFNQATAGLKGTDRERLAGIVMAGYQLENIFLILNAIDSLPETLTPSQSAVKQQLAQYIFEYQGKFEVIYQFVQAHSDPLDPDKNPNYPFFDNGLRELIEAYQRVTESDPNFSELQEKVMAIRNKIVHP